MTHSLIRHNDDDDADDIPSSSIVPSFTPAFLPLTTTI